MKFWQKAFFCVIAVFLLGFDAMGYILVEQSYRLNRDYAIATSETEQQGIKESFYESLVLSERNFSELNEANLGGIISPYASFYQNQGIYFQLYQSGARVYDNLPAETAPSPPDVPEDKQLVSIIELGGAPYLFISSGMGAPFDNIDYIYIKDMRSLSDFKTRMIETFTGISAAVSLILAIAMLFLLIGLTRPFRKLNAVTSEISRGHYDKRVLIKSRDELGDFAKNFNLMADRIEEHIDALSGMTESKQRFIDNLAHEIRTPTTAIIGYGELLKYANCSEEEKETAVRHIIGQGKRIQSLSRKLLGLASMDNDTIEKIPVDLAETLNAAEGTLEPLLRAKQITIKTAVPPLSVMGDMELLKSLFINLLENAANASPEGTQIEICAGQNDETIAVAITDHGKGMAADELQKITEPFYRVDPSRSRAEGGAGLGLALCSRICEIHSAKLDVLSTPGQGTTVTVNFPGSEEFTTL